MSGTCSEYLQNFAMNHISDDILLLIFSFFNKKELCEAAKVNKRWHRVSCDPSLWKDLNLQRILSGHSSDFLNPMVTTRLSSLRNVHFGPMHIKFKTLKSVLVRCKKLETIIFGRGSRVQKHAKRKAMIIPQNIQTLDMRLAKGNFEFLLASGPRFQSLVHFGIGRDSYTHNFFPHLFCQATNLKILDLTNCDSLVDDQLYDVFTRCTLLESLCLIGCRKLTGTFLPNLARTCRRLQTLLIRYMPITDSVLCSCEWDLLPLEEIDISACPEITWMGLSSFIPKLNRVRYLNMSYCGIGHAVTDAILTQLLVRGIASKIEMLDLRWSFLVSAHVLREFLSSCKNLQYLGIYQSNGVNSSVVSDVAKHLPRLKTIEFGGLKQEILTSSHMLQSLRENCKQLSVLSLINFCTISVPCDERQFEELIKSAKNLERINLCDCSEELVAAARTGALNTQVNVTERWECALPPPVHTLDFVTRCTH